MSKRILYIYGGLYSPNGMSAIISQKINYLAEHFKKFPKDFASRIGFLKMIGKRRRLLDYLKKSDKNAYSDILKKLG